VEAKKSVSASPKADADFFDMAAIKRILIENIVDAVLGECRKVESEANQQRDDSKRD
jgi:hypothetical protein